MEQFGEGNTPVQVWPQETKLQASYELLNIWLVVLSWSAS